MMSKFSRSLLIVAALSLCTCGNTDDGERLAKKHCSSCHLFPDPALLDKKTWQAGVFPEMSLRMGLDISRLPGTTPAELAEILTAIPPAPLVSTEEWETIRDYFVAHAPDSLEETPAMAPLPLSQFACELLSLPIQARTMVTMVAAHPPANKVFLGTREGKLYELNRSLTPADSVQLSSPPSHILFDGADNTILSCMGIMDPNDQRAGSIVNRSGKAWSVLLDSLKRPVYIQRADLNNDGQDDLLVSAFGNFTGALLLYERNGDRYHEHLVHHFPGTRKTIVRDFNKDGLSDILALITQGDEQIALFTNRGKFKFSYQVLKKFPPVYGSSYFELGDFNGDGNPDILYTNGDNADYSAVLKPYHGVRIFLNDGANHFDETWFHPMHGASMARAHDFDEDGDLDIAAISFFPDFSKQPQRGFLYFENDGGKFTAHETPLAASSRWITIESADIDADGDIDLLLGALAFPTGVPDSLYQAWGRKKTSLLVLRNTLR